MKKEIEITEILPDELEKNGIKSWPIWEKEVSKFDWFYEEREQFYLIEGKVKIKTENNEYEISAGSFVTCSKGLACSWEVIEPVRKYYNFG